MKKDLLLYNTLTRKKEIFKPIKHGIVRMYTCGPTVYWYQHIGNMRSYIFSDILKRILLYNGYKVTHVINVTDVGHLESDEGEGEDKIELAAKKEGKKAGEIAKFYLDAYIKDLEKLNILMPDKWPKASEHIKEQIDMIKKLEKKNYTYKTSDGIYFDSSRLKDYGKLAKLNIKGLKKGKRVAQREKKNKTDFALWKFSPEKGKRQQEWESPWGVGFPGWHIECSAMSIKYLGNTIDIHTGGEDHIPIHHTNEIAQSEATTGKKFVNYWLHGSHLLNRGDKISKSSGGLYTISELETISYKPIYYRYFVLMTHYRKQLNFSLDNLDIAKNTIERFNRKILELKKAKHKGNDLTNLYLKRFENAINNDLNTPKALNVLWNVLDDFDFDPKKKLLLLEKFDSVLGLGIKELKEEEIDIPKDVKNWLAIREAFRKEKKFVKADNIRQRIKEAGYDIEDKEKGPKLYKI